MGRITENILDDFETLCLMLRQEDWEATEGGCTSLGGHPEAARTRAYRPQLDLLDVERRCRRDFALCSTGLTRPPVSWAPAGAFYDPAVSRKFPGAAGG